MTALCHDLQQQVNVIGLNVKASNDYAVRCYKKLGFEIVGTYDECLLRNDNKLS
jgi:ribosomal protein S18 acetylase RimI-like enzyme